MSKTIALIGLSGCGKTTYGKVLANKLNRAFYDIDQIIETEQGMSISQIFSEKGEAYFREIEWETFMRYCKKSISIISTGGGLVPHAFQLNFQKPEHIFFLYMETPIETIAMRLSNPEALCTRPLMSKNEDLYKQIEILHNQRSQAYLAWADGRLRTN